MTVTEMPQVRLGHFLRDARESSGFNQGDFGAKITERVGGKLVTQTRVSRWERGKEYPDVLQMRAIADISGHEYLLDLRALPSRWTTPDTLAA